MRIIRNLLALLGIWLSTSAFIPIGFIAAAAAFGGGMAATGDGMSRPKPFVRPSQIIFGISTSKTELAWRVVDLEPEARQVALLRMRAGFEPEGGLFAVAR